MLEKRVFLDPTIDTLLRDNFVEVRLHTDGSNGPRKDRNLALQKQLASSIANPWLVVVDPSTETPGMETGFREAAGMAEFLQSVVQ